MIAPLEKADIAPHGTTASVFPSFHGADALNYRAPAEIAARNLGYGVEFDAVTVPAGSCVVHGQDTWHGSGPNISGQRHRRALVVHFIPGNSRFIDGHSLQVEGCVWSASGRVG